MYLIYISRSILWVELLSVNLRSSNHFIVFNADIRFRYWLGDWIVWLLRLNFWISGIKASILITFCYRFNNILNIWFGSSFLKQLLLWPKWIKVSHVFISNLHLLLLYLWVLRLNTHLNLLHLLLLLLSESILINEMLDTLISSSRSLLLKLFLKQL